MTRERSPVRRMRRPLVEAIENILRKNNMDMKRDWLEGTDIAGKILKELNGKKAIREIQF